MDHGIIKPSGEIVHGNKSTDYHDNIAQRLGYANAFHAISTGHVTFRHDDEWGSYMRVPSNHAGAIKNAIDYLSTNAKKFDKQGGMYITMERGGPFHIDSHDLTFPNAAKALAGLRNYHATLKQKAESLNRTYRSLLESLTPDHVEQFSNQMKAKHGLSKFRVWLHRDNTLELSDFEVPKGQRGAGVGGNVMKELTGFADQHKKRVWLQTADRDSRTGTTSKARLQRFYGRHGFIRNHGRNKDFALSMYASMYREPK